MRISYAALLLLICVSLFACLSVTLSRDAAVDFGTYRVVYVEVDAVGFSDYLATELNRDSGFERATTISGGDVNANLTVNVSVAYEPETDDFNANAEFQLRTTSGELLLQGEESVNSSFEEEAIEDVLDEVSNVFLTPYNI